jgi:hypothetical protein
LWERLLFTKPAQFPIQTQEDERQYHPTLTEEAQKSTAQLKNSRNKNIEWKKHEDELKQIYEFNRNWAISDLPDCIGELNTEHGHTTLVREMQKIKRIDILTALDISGMAGMPSRDKRGNIMPTIWAKQVHDMEKEGGILIESNDLRKILLNLVHENVTQRAALLTDVSTTRPLVDWIAKTADEWERRYSEKLNEKYDISTGIYAAMQEVYFEIEPFLESHEHAGAALKIIKDRIEKLREKVLLVDTSYSHLVFPLDKAIVRAMFRFPAISSFLNRMAAKLLQKKEVCSKAGTYSSRVQRNDIVQEYNDAIAAFIRQVDSTPSLLQSMVEASDPDNPSPGVHHDFVFLIIDHAAIEHPISASAVPLPMPSVL